jgi:hypothetical protein
MAWTGPDPAFTVSVYSAGYGYGPNIGLTKEDLLDLITNIDPWDNIVFAMLPKRRAKSTTHEWPVDVLPTVGRSGVVDGASYDSASTGPITRPYRMKNFTQIFRWDASVTGTEAEVDTAGIGDKLAYQILNGTHAMAKAVEQRIFDLGTAVTASATTYVLDNSGQFTSYPGFSATPTGSSLTAVPGYGGEPTFGASATARKFAPLHRLIAATGAAGTPIATGAWVVPIVDMAGTTLAFATKVDDLCEIMFANGLSPETLVLNQGSKRDLANDLIATSGNSTINTRFLQASERKVIRGVDVYEGELCTLSVIPNRSIAATSNVNAGYGSAWVLQKDKLGIAFLRPIKAVPLAIRGDSTEKMLIGEMTLELLHPVGAGMLAKVIT